MSDAEAQFQLYTGRMESPSTRIAPSPKASGLDAAAVGATEARAYTVIGHPIELVLLHFTSSEGHEPALEKIHASGWPDGHQFDFAGGGPMLLLVRAPESAGDQEETIDELLTAFSGEE